MVKPEYKIEKYAFLRLYEHDFEMALHTIKLLRRCRNKEVRYSLLRDIVVTYCRPFTESRGKDIKKDFLGFKKYESENMKALHARLMHLRGSLFAHTDLTFKNPQIANWSEGDRKWFPMAFTFFDYEKLDGELPEIENLIKFTNKALIAQLREFEKSF